MTTRCSRRGTNHNSWIDLSRSDFDWAPLITIGGTVLIHVLRTVSVVSRITNPSVSPSYGLVFYRDARSASRARPVIELRRKASRGTGQLFTPVDI